MSNHSPVHLVLPHLDLGSRKIRIIYLMNQTSFSLTNSPDQDRGIPLYLGADLLSNTEVRTENHPRCHAKFAKKGLATKITFSSAFRFQGMKVPASNNSLWFYNVQGLFRVAFEMYNKQEQLAVLVNVQDVWKSQINEGPLEINYSLSMQLDFPESPNVPSTEIRSSILKNDLNKQLKDVIHASVKDTAGTSAGHEHCSFSTHGTQTEKIQPCVAALRQKLSSLDHQLCSQPQTGTERLETLMLLFQNIDQYLNNNLEEKDTADAILSLLKAKDWSRDSVYSSYLLSSVGQWLGQQFHAANGRISRKVEGFKVQHIERISDLPPAEELVTELFPEAMKTLLLHWMGLSEESTVEKRHSEYPILLLILEFANHSLITGVAHVLYSSLICK